MWKYQDLLNQNLQILILLALGAGAVILKLFSQKSTVITLNRLVFYVLLPSSVLLGLGIRSNLRDETLWRFVGAFLMLRAFCLLGSVAVFGIGPWRRGIGMVTMNWLVVSWISTVILGVPLLRAALGPQYASLGVVAGISSFIFQLPLMLILFEVHAGGSTKIADEESQGNQVSNTDSNNDDKVSNHDKAAATAAPPRLFLRKDQWRAIGLRLGKNPILWAIVIGIIFSVTTLGPKYLNPGNPPAAPNCSYEPGSGFIFLTLSTLAACTEPIALFATGAFLVHRNPLAIGVLRAAAYMIIKLILVPAIGVGCALAVGLEGAEGRAAVLIAALPISAAAFVLASQYGIGEDVAVSNLFFGNVLVLPTTLGWMAFMDAVDLFPVPSPVVPNVCATPPPAAAG
jgi:predicted permease